MGANDVDREDQIRVIFRVHYVSFVFSVPLFSFRGTEMQLSRRGGNDEGETAFVRSGARCGPVATPARLGIQLTATPGLGARRAFDGFSDGI